MLGLRPGGGCDRENDCWSSQESSSRVLAHAAALGFESSRTVSGSDDVGGTGMETALRMGTEVSYGDVEGA